MIDLFDYNMKAYNSVIALLEGKKRAAVIHPTGTGKSFIGFKLCEEHSDKRICWLSPSEYIYKTQTENLEKTGASLPENIVFFTYAKLMTLDTSQLLEVQPDYIVLDEFHRCGAQMWGKGVATLLDLYKEASVLGLSATHIRYLDNQRDMADELFEGNIASEMTLGEAIVRGILPAPKYITTLYSYQEEVEQYEQRVSRAKNKVVRDEAAKYLESLRRTLENAEGLDVIFKRHINNKHGKFLAFCSSKEHLEEMVEKSKFWFGEIDREAHIYRVYSDDIESEESFQMFRNDESEHLKLLFCIDMLNEGVHVEDVSGVILFRPTISPIVYKQQIGRALSTAKGTTPIIFDIVNNIENLYAIDGIENEMKEAIQCFQTNKQLEDIVADTFTVYEEIHDCYKLFRKLNETLTMSWEMMYELAKRYYEEQGNLEVPKRYKTVDGYSLGTWVSVQRRVRKGDVSGRLDAVQIEKLDRIGMNWENLLEASFQRNYKYAQEYYDTHGDLDMGVDYVTNDGVKLGGWIAGVRRKYSAGTLLEQQIIQLENIGMIWEKFSYLWEQGYQATERYQVAHSSLEMSATYVDETGYKLGAWLNTQKRLYKEGTLDSQQIERLELLGIQWMNRYEIQWNQGYEAAKLYFELRGDLNVPVTYVDSNGYRLGDWLANQRGKASEKVPSERKEKLDAMGMVWNKRNSWEERYELAKNYYCAHGHLRVPSQYKVEGVWLNKWINEQKQIQIGNRPTKALTKEQVEKMEAIGMVWNIGKVKYCSDEYRFEVGV